MVYTPSVEPKHGNELRASIVGWVKDFYSISKLLTRLDSGEGDYLFEIESDVMLRRKMQGLSRLLSTTESEC
eukprot:SAG11_NODE_29407_length_311_cov_0.726415_1_plen_71_part_01